MTSVRSPLAIEAIELGDGIAGGGEGTEGGEWGTSLTYTSPEEGRTHA
jgi:hypothetical protein